MANSIYQRTNTYHPSRALCTVPLLSIIKAVMSTDPLLSRLVYVVMVKSVVYYYELRIYVLAVWPLPDGSGICSPYTGDRDP